MKKLNYLFAALMTMLLVVGCSNDELVPVANDGDEALVAFNIGLPGDGLNTRAIADGKTVNQLVYAIYEGDTKIKQESINAFGGSLEYQLAVTLLKGKTYKIAFWAQSENFHKTDNLKAVEINYEGGNNNEKRDAFFGSHEFTVVANASIAVELHRPFAQINVGTTEEDYKAAEELVGKGGIKVTQSKVVINNVKNTINLFDGTVSGTATAVTYDSAAIPTDPETLEANGEDYRYLSMSYILVGEKKDALESLSYVFSDGKENGKTVELSQGLTNVPVQRNYRTNILGQLLTGDITFDITIEPGFETPDYEVKYNEAQILAALQEAFKADANGINISMDGKDIAVDFDNVDLGEDGLAAIQGVFANIMKPIADLTGENVELLVKDQDPFKFSVNGGDSENYAELYRLGLFALKVSNDNPIDKAFNAFVTNTEKGAYKTDFTIKVVSKDDNPIFIMEGMSVDFGIVTAEDKFLATLQGAFKANTDENVSMAMKDKAITVDFKTADTGEVVKSIQGVFGIIMDALGVNGTDKIVKLLVDGYDDISFEGGLTSPEQLTHLGLIALGVSKDKFDVGFKEVTGIVGEKNTDWMKDDTKYPIVGPAIKNFIKGSKPLTTNFGVEMYNQDGNTQILLLQVGGMSVAFKYVTP